MQLTVRVPIGCSDVLEAVVWGGTGWESRAGAALPDGVEERPSEDGSVLWVISWVDSPPSAVLDRLSQALAERGAVVVSRGSVAADAGADAWRSWAQPWRAGPFVVRPPWIEPPRSGPSTGLGAVDVVVDPGALFGSGSHQSTRMAMALLADLVHAGDAVVDVGSGSGILGVAAALLGAASVDLVELDARGEQAGLANAVRNGVADRVRWAGTDLAALAAPADGDARVVLANLLIGQLEAVAPTLRALAGVGGTLVLAGVLEHQVSRLLDALAPANVLTVVVEASETDPSVGWAALSVQVAEAGDDPAGKGAPCG